MPSYTRRPAASKGFTLSELLIALAILGLIATFTIPKVLQSVGNSSNKTVVREAASMISGAFDAVTADQSGIIDYTNDKVTKLAAKFNYVETVATGSIQNSAGAAGTNCAAGGGVTCYRLHNGAILAFDTDDDFDASSSTGAMVFHIDPDGTGTAASVSLVLGSNGRMISGADLASVNISALTTAATTGADGLTSATTNPSWFTWSG